MASDVCSLEATQAHPSPCPRGACTEIPHSMGRPPSCPTTFLSHPSPLFGPESHICRGTTTTTKDHLQVLHVGDAPERLPRDPQDLVFAQISKQEEKRHTALRTQARRYLHLIMTTKPLGWRPLRSGVVEGLFSLRPPAATASTLFLPRWPLREWLPGGSSLPPGRALWVVSHLQATSQDSGLFVAHTAPNSLFCHLPEGPLAPLLSCRPSPTAGSTVLSLPLSQGLSAFVIWNWKGA